MQPDEIAFEELFTLHECGGLDRFIKALCIFTEQQGTTWKAALRPDEPREFRARATMLYQWVSRNRYATFRLSQLDEASFSFWIYHSRECQAHADLDQIALPPSHVFWQTHTPRNGWFCTCYLSGTSTVPGIRRQNGDPDKPLPIGWDTRDPRTGLPAGIAPGFLGRQHPSLYQCLDHLNSL